MHMEVLEVVYRTTSKTDSAHGGLPVFHHEAWHGENSLVAAQKGVNVLRVETPQAVNLARRVRRVAVAVHTYIVEVLWQSLRTRDLQHTKTPVSSTELVSTVGVQVHIIHDG